MALFGTCDSEKGSGGLYPHHQYGCLLAYGAQYVIATNYAGDPTCPDANCARPSHRESDDEISGSWDHGVQVCRVVSKCCAGNLERKETWRIRGA